MPGNLKLQDGIDLYLGHISHVIFPDDCPLANGDGVCFSSIKSSEVLPLHLHITMGKKSVWPKRPIYNVFRECPNVISTLTLPIFRNMKFINSDSVAFIRISSSRVSIHLSSMINSSSKSTYLLSFLLWAF